MAHTPDSGQAGAPRQSFDGRAAELGIELKPASGHPTAVRLVDGVLTETGLLFLSGTGPIEAGKPLYSGQIGSTLSLEQGKAAARATAIRVLHKIVTSVGSLDRVDRWVSVTGYVNCSDDFTAHPQVLDGFTDLIVDVFGEQAGLSARCTVGTSSLPLGIPVEVQAVLQIAPDTGVE